MERLTERSPRLRVALTGNVALELLAPYFREAGYDVHGPDSPPIDEFRPDYVYDVTSHDAVLSEEVPGFFDSRLAKLSGCPYSLDGIRAIVDEFEWERLRAPKKVLAVDADNTLWKGILSEDGRDALVPYEEFQRGLRGLRDDGVALVLLSKNDPFELDWFTLCRVNWAPKAGNLLDACRALNLPPDSVVFVDDNPFERAQMSAHLPEVTVAPFPANLAQPRQFLRRLREYFFSGMGATAEDRLRAADYARPRPPLRQFATTADYLDDLALWVRPSTAAEGDLDRLAQMAGKTNQFNATTIRRTRQDFEALLKRSDIRVFVFRAGDRFGEQGLVCYVVADLASRRITDFVMSCRAMGRTLEHFAYGYVSGQLGYAPAIDFTPTAKNAPFAAFRQALADGTAGPTHFHEVD